MAAQGGISGVAVGMATAGAFLLWIGIQGVDVRAGLKSLTSGKLPEGKARDKAATEAAAAAIGRGQDFGEAGAAAGAVGGALAGAVPVGAGGGGRVVAAARQYLGVPYQWGGTSKAGIDCSGLVVRAWQGAYDVTPPRTTYTQVAWKQLKPVDRSLMSAGDLCFWPRGGPPSHVAIAVDGARVIHAPRPGKRVEEVPVGQAFTGGAAPAVYRYMGSKG